MLAGEQFVRQSLELNLFFLRILKEHAIFLRASLTPRDANLAWQADNLKNQAAQLLRETAALSDGTICPDVAVSGEIVTDYTLEAERAAQFYTGIPIDMGITQAELNLVRDDDGTGVLATEDQVALLNDRAMKVGMAAAEFKRRLLNDVLCCRVYTHLYPHLLEHIFREVKYYINVLGRLQQRQQVDLAREMVEQELFWNRIMGDHARYIRGLLDPSEEVFIEKAHLFSKDFDALTAQALALVEQPGSLPSVTAGSLEAAADFREFSRQGTEGILACRIRSVILPLLADHVLREASHYLRLLKEYSKER